jgi:SAM-dependent methyltransferase
MESAQIFPCSWEQAVKWLREQPDRQELVQACYYDDPLLEAAKRFAASNEWQTVTRLLPPPAGRALDIGAGRGISSYALAAAGWQVTALEPDPGDLVGTGAIRRLANESRLPITVIQGTAEEMEFDGIFDLVYCREVLHHARDLRAMLRAAARALKPGGMLLACREHVISRREDLKTFQANHPLHHLYGGENAFLLDEYIAAIRAGGLRLKKIYAHYETPINYFPLTEKQWRETISAPLKKRLGPGMTDFLCNPVFPWSGIVNHLLAMLLSRLNGFPGRLYTFMALKPR